VKVELEKQSKLKRNFEKTVPQLIGISGLFIGLYFVEIAFKA
jgi:hypothetical protein